MHVRHLHAQLRPELRLIFFWARLSLLVGTVLNVINQGDHRRSRGRCRARPDIEHPVARKGT
uniref:hypothetical protein n=1 Tax=Comamonas sp. 7D-2 TaxID=1232667 RepID=UPI0015632310|nr:hypothetical protein [Comamonas sp. 7D-2]